MKKKNKTIKDKDEFIKKAIDFLPKRNIAVMKLRYLEGKMYKEIAAELDMSVGAVGSLVDRSKKILQDWWVVGAIGEEYLHPKKSYKERINEERIQRRKNKILQILK